MLYPSADKPLFAQLKNIIRQKIAIGEYKEGDRLPGERQCAETYGISRMTARQALNELVQEGILLKRRGSGYYVATIPLENSLDRLQGLIEELVQQNMNFAVEVEQIGYVKAPPKVSATLELGSDNNVFLLVRRVTLDSKPLAMDYTYLPMALGELVRDLDMTKQILYHYLELNGYHITDAKQTISAGQLMREETAALGRPQGYPILVIDRTAYVEGSRPLVYSHTLYLSDRYHYTLRLKR